MRVLGAILAGGRSTRFGTDKAVALLYGRPLIEHAIEALAGQCDAIIVVGRQWPGFASIADCPEPNCGPLGGLGGALHHARENDFDAVLTCAVDSLGLPADLSAKLSPAPAFVESQPVVGLWPASGFDALNDIMRSERRSMLAFAERIGARAVKLSPEPANVNTPDDLARWEQAHGL